MAWARCTLVILFAVSISADQPLTQLRAPTGDTAKGWFQKTEEALMDAIATGDKAVWNRVLDDKCIYTSKKAGYSPNSNC